MNDIKTLTEACELRLDVTFVRAQKIETLGLVPWTIAYEFCELPEVGEGHARLTETYTDPEPLDILERVPAAPPAFLETGPTNRLSRS